MKISRFAQLKTGANGNGRKYVKIRSFRKRVVSINSFQSYETAKRADWQPPLFQTRVEQRAR
jgi:hypothetical protein